MSNLSFRLLSRELMTEKLEEIISISRGVPHDNWEEESYLAKLPRKWELSRACFSGDGLAGYIIASDKGSGKLHIHKYVVREDERGKGTGRAMLRDLIDNAGQQTSVISLKVYADNIAGVRFYENNNFVITALKNDLVVMELRTGDRNSPGGSGTEAGNSPGGSETGKI